MLFALVSARQIRHERIPSFGRIFWRGAAWGAWYGIAVAYAYFVFTDWMLAYMFDAGRVPLAASWLFFFVTLAIAGGLGAMGAQALLERGKWVAALGLGLFFLSWIIIIFIVQGHEYNHFGTYTEYHAGVAIPLELYPAAQQALMWQGALAVLGTLPLLVPGIISEVKLYKRQSASAERAKALTLEVPERTPRDPADAVAIARQAQRAWAAVPLGERLRTLSRIRNRFLGEAERIAATVESEIGHPRGGVYMVDVLPNVDLFDYYGAEMPRMLARRPIPLDPINFPGKSGAIEYLPRGVLALISPWNFPVALPLRTIVPALAAGNAVVFKPSEHALRSGQLVAEIFNAELPRGVLTLLQGAGDVGAALVEANPDAIIFTGSVATGRAINEAAAKQLIPVSLELGGKDAAIVLDDAPLERTVNGIVWGAFYNSGQNCSSIERLYVTSGIYDRFVEALVAETKRLRVGVPDGSADVDVGPLANDAQLAKVSEQVAEARDGGARVLCGGEPGAGRIYPPTLLVDVAADAAILNEETFGPVLPVVRVKDAEEAVGLANASRYGLTASVWTADVSRGAELARRIQVGTATVNNHSFTGAIPSAPWSGTGESGFGVTNSEHAVMEMVRTRVLLEDRYKGKRELWWYPYNAALLTIGRAMSQLRRKGAPGKLGAVGRLLSGFGARFK